MLDRRRSASFLLLVVSSLTALACSTEAPGSDGAVPPEDDADILVPSPVEDAAVAPRDGSGERADARPEAGRDARVSSPRDGGVSTDPGPGRDASSVEQRDASESARDAATGGDGADGGVSDGCPAAGARAINRVRIRPAAGRGAELTGAKVQGSNSGPTTDFVDLATIEAAPAEGRFTELRFANEQRYRYVKIYAERSAGAVAELEFYDDALRVAGEPFSTVPAGGSAAAQAFDGDPATLFRGSLATGNYVGLDIGGSAVAATPTFQPAAGSYAMAPEVTLSTGNAGASIRYTLDGSNPTRSSGMLYEAPFRLMNGRVTVKAIAYSECTFDSAVASAAYQVGTTQPPPNPEARGLRSYHIGNSLTDTINDWLEPIADSTGVDHVYSRWTIPGAPVAWIWDNKGSGIGTPEGAVDIDTHARTFAPIDHMSVQPYADPSLEPQAGAAIKMLNTVRAHSPNVQFWVYAQWAPHLSWSENALAIGAGWATPSWSVPRAPTSWEQAIENQLLYHEAFRKWVDDRTEGKSPLVVPAGLAMRNLKRAVEAGQVPGMSDFFAAHFEDDEHLTDKGQYLVALVFYACFYRQSPEGRVTFEGSTLTEAQARVYQRIAWETAVAYPWSGLSAP